MRFRRIFGSGMAMGLGPRQIRDMSLWEFGAAVDGWVEANSAEGGSEPPSEEFLAWALEA